MKRLIILGLGLLLAMSVLSIAEAANPDTMELYVTVTGVLSVDIIDTGLSFGSVNPNDTSVLTSSATVRNDSTGLTESYRIKGSNSVPSNWTLASAATGPDEDQFVLYAACDEAQPADADGTWSDDDLEVSDQDCSSTVFSIDGSHTGVNVPANNPGDYTATGSDRWLWFRIKTPTSLTVGSGEAQTITVTVTAY
jgi:hypothetical protein